MLPAWVGKYFGVATPFWNLLSVPAKNIRVIKNDAG